MLIGWFLVSEEVESTKKFAPLASKESERDLVRAGVKRDFIDGENRR